MKQGHFCGIVLALLVVVTPAAAKNADVPPEHDHEHQPPDIASSAEAQVNYVIPDFDFMTRYIPSLHARYSMVELDDGPITGGRHDRIEVGLNWWATTRWKAGIVAGRIWLHSFGTTGITNSILTRLQWVY